MAVTLPSARLRALLQKPEGPSLYWSILVCTVPSRLTNHLPRLLLDLTRQADGFPVEILAFFDNKHRSVGAKRNGLLRLAQGRYVSFVDDDDRIAPTYVTDIIEAIHDRPDADVIVFDSEVRLNGGTPKRCVYGLEYAYTDLPDLWTGRPAHTMVWRRDLVADIAFPESNYGEDFAWVRLAASRAKVQARIPKLLYFYDFHEATSETRSR